MGDLMKRYFFLALLILVSLAACRPQLEVVTPAHPSETAAAKPNPTPTPTPNTPKTLTICTQQLPERLFLYDGLKSPAKMNLLAMIYDSFTRSTSGGILPGILAQIPSQANGGLRLAPVTVRRGQTVVDAEGALAVFKPGLRVRPSGCQEAGCAVVWDGEAPLQMDQMTADFELQEGLAWSDGTPVLAGDSVFSFQLAAAPEAPGLHWAEDRTEAYQAVDSQRVQWVGRPGFTTGDLSQFFWTPLPAHLFSGEEGWDEMAEAEALALTPLSYGPFMIQERELDRLYLIPNPHYYRVNEGLPLLDEILYQESEGGRDGALQALQSGQCDVLDASFGWENDPDLLSALKADGGALVQAQTGGAWWQLTFGISPAAVDDPYTPAQGNRPDFFGDPRVRHAFAVCLDREEMRRRALGDWGQLWPSFLPPGESQLSEDVLLKFNPEQGAAELDAVGWLDADANPATPRTALGVPDVPDGTVLRVELVVDETQFQQDMAAVIQESLAVCGVEVGVQTIPSEQLYAPGPEGPLFGRRFDLSLIAWGAAPALDCRLYMNQAIPSEENQWVGTNIAGLAEPAYDQACASAELAWDAAREAAIQEAERLFLSQLPAVPLFSSPEVMVFSPHFCEEERLTSGKGFINTIENFMGDKNCP